MRKLLKHPLMSGGLIMVGGSMGVNAINYLYHLLMGRLLGPVDYGVLASLYSIIYLLGIVPISASVAIVKFISAARDKKEVYSIYLSLKKLVFYIAAVVSIVLLVSSPVIAKFLNIANFWLVSLLAVVNFFILVVLVNQATAQGLLKFSGSVIPNLISSVVKTLVGIILVILGFSVFGAVVGVVLASALAYFYSVWFIVRHLKKEVVEPYRLNAFLRYSFPVLVQAFAFTSLFTVDVILVKHFLSPFCFYFSSNSKLLQAL